MHSKGMFLYTDNWDFSTIILNTNVIRYAFPIQSSVGEILDEFECP